MDISDYELIKEEKKRKTIYHRYHIRASNRT